MKLFNKIILAIIGISIIMLIFSFVIGFRTNDVKAFFYESYKYEKVDPYETSEQINHLKLNLDTKYVVIKGHDDDKITINYYIREKETVNIKVNDRTMVIEQTIKQRLFSVNFQIPDKVYITIEILVPKNKQIKLDIDAKVSNIEVENVLLKSSSFKTNTGKILLKDIISEENIIAKTETGTINLIDIELNDLLVTSNTGVILLNNIVANDIDLTNSTGSLRIVSVQAKNIFINNSTGLIYLDDTIGDKIKINSSTSSVKLNETYFKNTQIYLSTGNISLKGKYNNYSLKLKTNTGKIIIDGNKKSREFLVDRAEDIIIAETSTGKIVVENIN